jgi:hypothetical protein
VHAFQYYRFLLDDGYGSDGVDDTPNEGDTHRCLLEELDSMELLIVGGPQIVDKLGDHSPFREAWPPPVTSPPLSSFTVSGAFQKLCSQRQSGLRPSLVSQRFMWNMVGASNFDDLILPWFIEQRRIWHVRYVPWTE